MIVHFVESMLGIRAVQAFRREPRNQEIFDDVNEQYRVANLRAFRLVAWFMPGIKLIGNITIAVVLLYGGYLAFHGEVDRRRARGVPALPAAVLRADAGDLAVLQHLPVRAAPRWRSSPACSRRSPASPSRSTRRALDQARGDVRFEGVRFDYVEGTAVLPGLDLDGPGRADARPGRHDRRGQDDAGQAGCPGSTTRPAGGSRLDGVDLRDLDEPTLRKAVVMVTQENYLFGGTVADNIRFGRPDATDGRGRRGRPGHRRPRLHHRDADGYDTDVANQGGRLSAGQRQLVAFARAFLADPAVLILDEATSSLDVPSERLVQRALRTILAGPHRGDHRPPALDGGDRRPGAGHGARPDRRGRLAGRTSSPVPTGRFSDLHEAWLELYDLRRDPFELRNLASDPAESALVRSRRGGGSSGWPTPRPIAWPYEPRGHAGHPPGEGSRAASWSVAPRASAPPASSARTPGRPSPDRGPRPRRTCSASSRGPISCPRS